MTRTVEREAAELTPPHAAPEIAAEIRRAVREARGLPPEAAILPFPQNLKRNPNEHFH